MNTVKNDVFAQMKKEDRKFGERAGKSAKVQAKGPKHRQDFKNLKPQDILQMSEDFDLENEDELESNLEDA